MEYNNKILQIRINTNFRLIYIMTQEKREDDGNLQFNNPAL